MPKIAHHLTGSAQLGLWKGQHTSSTCGLSFLQLGSQTEEPYSKYPKSSRWNLEDSWWPHLYHFCLQLLVRHKRRQHKGEPSGERAPWGHLMRWLPPQLLRLSLEHWIGAYRDLLEEKHWVPMHRITAFLLTSKAFFFHHLPFDYLLMKITMSMISE